MPTPRTYQLAAWALLGLVFVAAYAQGPDFASTKETATAFGALIGLRNRGIIYFCPKTKVGPVYFQNKLSSPISNIRYSC